MVSGMNGVIGVTAVSPVGMELGTGPELVDHPYMVAVIVSAMQEKTACAILIIVQVSIQYIQLY